MLANERGWRVAVAGEFMVTRGFRNHMEPEFLKLKELLERADVSYGHLEMNFGEYDEVYPSRGNWQGSFMLAEPEVAKDIRWFGMDMMSLAHNHSFDYGPEAVKSTIRACREAGIACAGTGVDLEEAREPAYWDGAAGRVALISVASGNVPSDQATLPKGGLRARPGINPLRVKMRYHIPAEMADKLCAIGKELKVLRKWREDDVLSGLEPGEFRLELPAEQVAGGRGAFVVGENYYVDSVCHPGDLEANLRSIRDAVRAADLVMVAHHMNYSDGARKDVPTAAAVEFAHAAIDAGADAYFGHGWHKTLGVEIYKNKPIFYGLGNFFMQSHFVRRLAWDTVETRGVDSKTGLASRPSDSPNPGIANSPIVPSLTASLIELEFTKEKSIRSITFYPVELGVNLEQDDAPISRRTGTRYAEGRPMLTGGRGARLILERLRDLSEPFGTHIRIDGDVGRWEA